MSDFIHMASKICILDDDSVFLRKIEAELHGYAVTTCPDAATFFQVFAPRCFDLIVLDMRLESGKEGLGVLQEIQRMNSYQATAVATAYADTSTCVEALQAGALLYIDKNRHEPQDLAALFDAVIQQGRLRRDFASAIRMLERMDPTELIPTQERRVKFLKAGAASTLQRNTKKALERYPELAERYPSVSVFFKFKEHERIKREYLDLLFSSAQSAISNQQS